MVQRTAGGVTTRYGYDPARGFLTSMVAEGLFGIVVDLDFSDRRGDGSLSGIRSDARPDLSFEYTYDAQRRLASATHAVLPTTYAFTYDEVTGTATFYVDGVAVDSFDGPDNAPLVIIADTPVELGVLMDFASAGQGTLDEVRLSDGALGPSGLLTPEPSNGLLIGLGLIALSAHRRRESSRA